MNAEFLIKEFARLEQWLSTPEKANSATDWTKFRSKIHQELSKSTMQNCHRDFHSRNIMFESAQSDKPFIIDIQDSRLGPEYYDIASFIVDPYQNLSQEQIVDILEYYGVDKDDPSFKYVYLQRGVKAINTYVKMVLDFQKNFYFPFIKTALNNINGLYPDFRKNYPEMVQTLWDFPKPD